MVLTELFYVATVPLAVAALVTLALLRVRVSPPVVWAASVTVGFTVGQLGVKSRGALAKAFALLARPHEAVDWLPHAVLLALGVTALATYAPRAWQRGVVALAAILSIGLPLRLLAGSVYVTQQWSPLEKLSYIALLAATFGLTWLLLSSPADSEHPRTRPVLLICVSAGSAIVIALSGALVYGELCGALTAALTGTALASALGATGSASARTMRSLTESTANLHGLSGAASVITFSLGSLIVLSCFYAKLAPANAAMLFLSLMLAGCRLPEFVLTWPGERQVALRTVLCLLPLAIALARSVAAAQAAMSASPYAM